MARMVFMATSTTGMILAMGTMVRYRHVVPSSSTISMAMKLAMDKATQATLAIVQVRNMLCPDIMAVETAVVVIRVVETRAAVTTRACGTSDNG
jgi:hypothetical protein